jgi:hypothetical protein
MSATARFWIPAKLNSSLILEIAEGRYISAAGSCGRDGRTRGIVELTNRIRLGSSAMTPVRKIRLCFPAL